MKKDIEAAAPKKKFMTNKERKKNLSRMQRKVNPRTESLLVVSAIGSAPDSPVNEASFILRAGAAAADEPSEKLRL